MKNQKSTEIRMRARSLRAAGNLAEAAGLYRKLVEMVPGQPDLWLDYGEVLIAQGDGAGAEKAFRQSVALKKDYGLGWHNLGFLLSRLQRDAEAMEALETAIRHDPKSHGSYSLLGTILHRNGKEGKALEAFDRAIGLKPDDVLAHNNKALALHSLGRLGEAAQAFVQALEHDLNDPAIHSNLGLVLHDMGQLEGAVRCYQRALERDPSHINTLNNMGNALAGQGRIEESLLYYKQAITIDPDFYAARSNYMFYLLHKDGATLKEIYDVHRAWAERHEAPFKSQWAAPDNIDKNPARPLRVGFVTGDFRNHPVFYFTISTLEALSRDPAYQLFAYANQNESDDCTPCARACFSAWHAIAPWNDEQVTEQIRKDQIDILIDLSGHNDRHRLQVFARRPAPVQVTWAGYMATTGLESIGWLLGDKVQTPPEDQPYYTERLYHLPDCFIGYTPPAYAPPLVLAPPCKKNGFITFGCFNKPAKISPRCIAVWSKILKAVPGSKIMLKFYGLKDPRTIQYMTEQFGTQGIAADRLILEGPSPHHELLQTYAEKIDIALDSMPYTGSTTTLESLWMGVPVIARHGDIFPARHSSTYLTAVGRAEWIADSDDEFIAKAIALAANPERLSEYRTNLRQQMASSPLCDGQTFAGHFKAALRHVWQEFCKV